MMRGFQIWPQNSNRTTFDPRLGKKTVKNRLSRAYSQFRQFFQVFSPFSTVFFV